MVINLQDTLQYHKYKDNWKRKKIYIYEGKRPEVVSKKQTKINL